MRPHIGPAASAEPRRRSAGAADGASARRTSCPPGQLTARRGGEARGRSGRGSAHRPPPWPASSVSAYRNGPPGRRPASPKMAPVGRARAQDAFARQWRRLVDHLQHAAARRSPLRRIAPAALRVSRTRSCRSLGPFSSPKIEALPCLAPDRRYPQLLEPAGAPARAERLCMMWPPWRPRRFRPRGALHRHRESESTSALSMSSTARS